MPVPDYQTFMRPVLALTEDGREWTARAIREAIAEQFELTPEQLEERVPSGRDTTFRNRIGWALTYLYRSGLLARPRRSVYQITERGRQVLTRHPDRVDNAVLEGFEEFRAFRARDPDAPPPRRRPTSVAPPPTDDSSATPEERAAAAYKELRAALASEVLDRVREQSPDFFEQGRPRRAPSNRLRRSA